MKAILLCMLLVGCAAPSEPVDVQAHPIAAAEQCPPLPMLKRGAGRKDMLAHIDTTARMYADCATRER